MNYLKYIPSEIYKESLFLVRPKDIFRVCSTNKYAITICDDKFYQEYIHRNLDPSFYGLENFLLPEGLNWKQFFNILVYGITLPAEVLDTRLVYNIEKTKVNIALEDTLRDIWNNVKIIINNMYGNMAPGTILIIANTDTGEKMGLFIYGISASLAVLDYQTDTIQEDIYAPKIQKIPIDAPMSQIGKNFYFTMDKIWVHIYRIATVK
jgi:hypothetical protein